MTRRTVLIAEDVSELRMEDLIKEEDVAITYTASGYIKRTSLSNYHFQVRGGKGKRGISMKVEDVVQDLFICSTHSYLLDLYQQGAYVLAESPVYSGCGRRQPRKIHQESDRIRAG